MDIGLGFELEPFLNGDEELRGYTITGPAAGVCKSPHNGRCGGLVPTAPFGSRAVWTIEQQDPLTLSPSIQCECGGQHGHVQNRKWVPA
jgi:hypothetical protein